jgi:2-keto-4-pentenoate hydratase
MPTKIEKVSEFIFQSHQRGDTFSNLENDMKPKDFAEAYDIQKRLRQKLPRGPLGGYKIALSSKIQQDYHNITQPVYGGLFRKEIFNSPKVIVLKNYHRMSVEFELAFELSDRIIDSKIHRNLENIFPAIELVDDRGANYEGLDPLSLACDNAWSGGLVLGDPIEDWKEKDFLVMQSTCEWNHEPKITTTVLDAKPFENLCWIINELHSCQSELKPGMIIITGSVFKVRQAKLGDKINHILSDHGKVSIEVV